MRPVFGTSSLPRDDGFEIVLFFADEYERNATYSELDEEQKTRVDNMRGERINVINRNAPKAYAPGKKLSRVFKALCDALGISDGTAGSEFQRLYAQFADELFSKKIGYKLYVSINPAHFLTMSNPKSDSRGCTLTSCHSFNSTEYPYNNGCSGYARDKYTFIVFTVADPANPETFNNRKTTRQIFAYKPGNGLLMQSRLYNTQGGTHGAQEESTLYRDLVQREISALEYVPNLWKTYPYLKGKESCVTIGNGFGGYADWTYSSFDGKVSIRNDHENDYEPLKVGTYGLCIRCGAETSEGLYCWDCKNEGVCECCGEHYSGERLTEVRDSDGEVAQVCDECLDEYYRWCDVCEEYRPIDDVRHIGDTCVCDDCFDEYYDNCEDCGEPFRRDEMYDAVDAHGNRFLICEGCRDRSYLECGECGNYVSEDDASSALDEEGCRLPLLCR